MIQGIQAPQATFGILSKNKQVEGNPLLAAAKEKGPNIGALLAGTEKAKQGITDKIGNIEKLGEANKEKLDIMV